MPAQNSQSPLDDFEFDLDLGGAPPKPAPEAAPPSPEPEPEAEKEVVIRKRPRSQPKISGGQHNVVSEQPPLRQEPAPAEPSPQTVAARRSAQLSSTPAVTPAPTLQPSAAPEVTPLQSPAFVPSKPAQLTSVHASQQVIAKKPVAAAPEPTVAEPPPQQQPVVADVAPALPAKRPVKKSRPAPDPTPLANPFEAKQKSPLPGPKPAAESKDLTIDDDDFEAELSGFVPANLPVRRSENEAPRRMDAEPEPKREVNRRRSSSSRSSEGASKNLDNVVASQRRRTRTESGKGGLGGGKGRFLAIVACVIGVIALAAMLFKGGKDDPSSDGIASGGSSGNGSSTSNVPIAGVIGEDFEDIHARAQDSLAKFFAAKSVEETVPLVRDPSRVTPLMKDYYERQGGFSMPPFRQNGPFQEIMVKLNTFWVTVVDFHEGGSREVVLEDTAEGFVVDWETFVSYNPMDWDKFAGRRPAEPMSFRVFAHLDHKFGYAFAEPQNWVCVQLSSRDSKSVLWGYAKRGSNVGLRLEELLKEEWEYPAILKLQFPVDSQGGDSMVHIRELVEDSWLHAN